MRILDDEIKLRDSTREVEQLLYGGGEEGDGGRGKDVRQEDGGQEGKRQEDKGQEDKRQEDGEEVKRRGFDESAIAAAYSERADGLSERQEGLAKRTLQVVKSIEELPEGPGPFQKEIQLLMRVGEVMVEATEILAEPDTGRRAVAAETEAIELLLQTKRVMGGGGGGGGSNPGGGGGGTTSASALALIGKGTNPQGQIGARSVNQQTGKTGRELPSEFRRGLDRFLSLPVTGGTQ